MKKRVVSFALALVLVCLLLPTTAFAGGRNLTVLNLLSRGNVRKNKLMEKLQLPIPRH